MFNVRIPGGGYETGAPSGTYAGYNRPDGLLNPSSLNDARSGFFVILLVNKSLCFADRRPVCVSCDV